MPQNLRRSLPDLAFWGWAGLVIVAYAAIRFWLMLSMPVSVDEATTYNYFTVAGFDFARRNYPAPNNHVLYSLLTTLLYHPGNWQTLLLRLPAFVFGLGSLYLFALVSRRFFPPALALLGLLVFGALEPVIYYGYMARGYSLLLFFSLASVALITARESFKVSWPIAIALALCTALGIYAVPSYLYFGLSLALALGWSALAGESSWPRVVQLGLAMLAGLIIAVFLYRPIIMNEGWSAITANSYVERKGIHFDQWWWHFGESGKYFLKHGIFYFVLLGTAILSLLWHWGRRPLVRMSAVMLVIMLLLPWLHGVIPFPRIWIYVAPFMVWLMLQALSLLELNLKIRGAATALSLLLVLAIAGLNVHSIKKINELEAGSVVFNKLGQKILKQPLKRLLLHDMYAQSFIPYYIHNSPRQFDLKITSEPFERREQFEQLCADYDLAVFSNYFPPGGPFRSCAVDSTWRYNLWTGESCNCLKVLK